MDLPRIENTESVQTEAVEAKTYPDIYIMNMRFNTREQQEGKPMGAGIVVRPYNFDTKELAPRSEQRNIQIEDIKALAEERALAGKPALADALTAVLAAVSELISEGY